jgi:hypothetical protein
MHEKSWGKRVYRGKPEHRQQPAYLVLGFPSKRMRCRYDTPGVTGVK